MQIYDKLCIGTAKPTREEMYGIPHHLIGFADPRKPFSCADYAPLAKKAAEDILSRGKLPVFCGGTGLYLDSVLKETAFSADSTDPAIHDRLEKVLAENGIEPLYRRLSEVDPESASAIHKNNQKRVLRALEIYLSTGIPKSEWDRRSHEIPPSYDACIIGLDYKDRSVLHDRINRRVTMMLDAGLYDEVRKLYADGDLCDGGTAAQAIGYKEFLACLRGEMTCEEAAERVRAASRQYAKRQLTWFRRNSAVHWLYPDTLSGSEQLTEQALRIFHECGST